MINEGRNTWNISEFVRLYKAGRIVLEPEFQRSHAWKNETRVALIESLLNGQPIPEIVVFRAEESDKHIVIDGKQRLETILHFLEVAPLPGVADLKVRWSGKAGTYRELSRDSGEIRTRMAGYDLAVVLQSGTLDEAGRLFIAWNTCSGLKPSEVRNAEQYSNPLFQEVKRLSGVLDQDLKALKVVSSNPADRMDKEEILAELLCTCYEARRAHEQEGHALNGKEAVDAVLDRVWKEHRLTDRQGKVNAAISTAASDVETTVRIMRQVLTAIPASRFRYRAMFYTLFTWVRTAMRAGYLAELMGPVAGTINQTLQNVSADILNAARANSGGQVLHFQEEVAEIVPALRYASDSRKQRERRLTALSSIFSRELGSALNMEAFPTVEEMLSHLTQAGTTAA